ncbi:similar to putative ATPase (predicted), isoform CRA_a [Rattus norvegicus]|uniref:Similar to putative ATPase (Predicted), isoform CRA_a n=1 Tax=Rattus norvegicus TaxID=10116 RepID=A6JRW4_RAT|nr:similar to putative ATPase (predicted), isoform CRA_a [Rattus norvegicus]
MQSMAKMDSTSTEPMKALNRSRKGSSNWEGKLQNSIFGPDCNLNCSHA